MPLSASQRVARWRKRNKKKYNEYMKRYMREYRKKKKLEDQK